MDDHGRYIWLWILIAPVVGSLILSVMGRSGKDVHTRDLQ